MMTSSTNETEARMEEMRAEIERLREALGWFLIDDRFQVAVGGNPIAVEKMFADAHAALKEPSHD